MSTVGMESNLAQGSCELECRDKERKPLLLERLTERRDRLAAQLDNVNRAIDVVASHDIVAENYDTIRAADRY